MLYLLQKLGVPEIHYYVANLPKVKAWPCRMACFHGWQGMLAVGGSFVGMLVLMFTGGLPMWLGILRTWCLGVGQGRKRENILNMESFKNKYNLYMADKIGHFLSRLLTREVRKGQRGGKVTSPQILKCVFSIE